MENKKILRVAIVDEYIFSFEESINEKINELLKNGKEIKDLKVISTKGGTKLIGIIYYEEYLDEIDNLPDEIL